MMNVLGLFLVLTSIAASGFFSPEAADHSKSKNTRDDDLIIKDRHRVIVVEYEREGVGFENPKTISSSSSYHHQTQKPKDQFENGHGLSSGSSPHGMFGRANDKFHEAASGFGEAYDKSKEIVDEAYGKAKECAQYKRHLIEVGAKGVKHTAESIPGTLSHAKEKVFDKTHSVKQAYEGAKESAAETLGQAKEKVSDKTHSIQQAYEGAKESATEKMKGIPETFSNAKEKVSDKTQDIKESIEESATETMRRFPETLSHAKEKVLDEAHTVKDTVTETTKAIPETLSQAKEKVMEKTLEIKDTIQGTAKEKPSYNDGTYSKAKKMVSDQAHDIEEATMDAKDTVTDKFHKAKEKVSEKAHEFKDTAEEAVTGYKKKKSAGFGVFNRAKDLISEEARIIRSAVTDKRSNKHKATQFFKEGARNFTSILYRGWDGAYDAAMLAKSEENVKWVLGVVRMIGFGTAYGTSVWVSFVSSHVLERALSRQQFAMVQSKIYPVYFRLMGLTVASSLMGQILSRRYSQLNSKGDKVHAYDLGISLGWILINLLFLEPRATKVMLQKMKLEKEGGGVVFSSRRTIDEVATDEISPQTQAGEEEEEEEQRERAEELEKLNQRLKKLNRYSALFNIMTVMTLTFHLAYLGQCLYVTC